MRYFLDCEFNGLGGDLLTMALIREPLGLSDDFPIGYWAISPACSSFDLEQWVAENVIPVISLEGEGNALMWLDSASQLPGEIAKFLDGDPDPVVLADWPEDFAYFSRAILTGPGTMIDIPTLAMRVIRVDAWPNDIPNLTQHNALHDATALMTKVWELEGKFG